MNAYKKTVLTSAVLTLLVSLHACGPSLGPPVEKIANIEMAITDARQSNAITYAPLELRFAEEKLKLAKQAMEKEDYVKAHRLAEQALLDAQLAEAKSRSERAKRLAQEMQESINEISSELNRGQ